jgi:hypothetical protein
MFKKTTKTLVFSFGLILMVGMVSILMNMGTVRAAACTDSDGGKDYYVKGVMNDGGNIYTDVCTPSGAAPNTLWERACTGSVFYDCPYGCEDGACKPGITVISPNGGEKWIEGQPYGINWKSNGIDKVNIEYGNGKSWRIAYNIPAKNGYYSWMIPEGIVDSYSGFVTGELSEFKTKINIWGVEKGKPEISDRSDNYFTIKKPSKPDTCLPNGTLIKLPNNPKIYVIQNCKRKWIRTQEEFKRQGYKWENIQEKPSDVVNAYAEYLETQAKLLRAIGQNKVYRIIGNKRLWVPTISAFNAQGLKWEGIEDKAETEVNQYPRAKLLRASGDKKVYYITDSGLKRHIPTADIFSSYGNKWEDVVEVEEEVVNSYKNSDLIRKEGGAKVYKLENGTKRWIKTINAFNRLRYNWSNIAPVNETELNTYSEGEPIE